MNAKFPTYSHSAKQADLGVNLVSRIVSDSFGWLFKRNHQEHDFGIDAHLEIITDEGAVTGQLIALQIKCGTSFFQEQNEFGHIYRGELKHFNYLANYPIPVVIVICDPNARECYWVHFQKKQTQATAAGWKLTVPFSSTLSSSKSALQSLVPAITDSLSELQEYWALNNMLIDAAVVVFVLDDRDIRTMDILRPRNFFYRLHATKELAFECKQKIEISISGYESDPRELFEIEEVRRYIALLDEALPELFFFVRAQPPANTLKLFVYCLMPVSWEDERSTPQVSRRILVDLERLPEFLEKHFLGLNLLAAWLGLAEDEIKRISYQVVKLIGLDTPPET